MPRACSAWRSASSALVSVLRTADIIRDVTALSLAAITVLYVEILEHVSTHRRSDFNSDGVPDMAHGV